MKKCICFLFVIMPALSYADYFRVVIGYECNQDEDELLIYYRGAYNEEGDALVESGVENRWSPWSFIESMESDDRIGTLSSIERVCSLAGKDYQIRIGPTPGSMSLQGACGVAMTAWVEVALDSEVIVPKQDMAPYCHDLETPTTTDILVNAASGDVEVKTVTHNEFYGW
ncbi:hypothetical protein BGP77_16670 [Saccharospirillum sp. MSK14-1]|uniref:hypothetical protein n=1 Tax=Saccharospirillum sp. MSK14-1 TaxID=1897632 RepID=UPI000D3D76E0|nr:hypothetical protein [Saccharospirillum sp. MSK14-1]PTY38084.1 hypothetical protein BGP77_16670 [Saccharospirillum sp. MSK14-1]